MALRALVASRLVTNKQAKRTLPRAPEALRAHMAAARETVRRKNSERAKRAHANNAAQRLGASFCPLYAVEQQNYFVSVFVPVAPVRRSSRPFWRVSRRSVRPVRRS